MRRGGWQKHLRENMNPTAAADPPEGLDRHVGDAGEFDIGNNDEAPSLKKHANIGGFETMVRGRAHGKGHTHFQCRVGIEAEIGQRRMSIKDTRSCEIFSTHRTSTALFPHFGQ